MGFSVPLFGTSSDGKSEALPGNRVYLTQAGAQEFKYRLLYLNPKGADPDFFNRDVADGEAKESMKH